MDMHMDFGVIFLVCILVLVLSGSQILVDLCNVLKFNFLTSLMDHATHLS